MTSVRIRKYLVKKAVTQIQPYISEQTVMLIMLMTKDEIEVYNYEYQTDSYEHSGFEYPY